MRVQCAVADARLRAEGSMVVDYIVTGAPERISMGPATMCSCCTRVAASPCKPCLTPSSSPTSPATVARGRLLLLLPAAYRGLTAPACCVSVCVSVRVRGRGWGRPRRRVRACCALELENGRSRGRQRREGERPQKRVCGGRADATRDVRNLGCNKFHKYVLVHRQCARRAAKSHSTVL